MWKDPIVDELHRIREKHAKQFDYDVRAMFEDLKTREKICGHKIVRAPGWKPKPQRAEA